MKSFLTTAIHFGDNRQNDKATTRQCDIATNRQAANATRRQGDIATTKKYYCIFNRLRSFFCRQNNPPVSAKNTFVGKGFFRKA
jgi:hypothetical protein